jgi:Holliday junction resolvase RusA-like endonuclease
MIQFTIPGEARGKGRPRFFNGRAITDSKTRSREGIVAAFASQAMGDTPAITGPVEVEIIAVMPVPASWSKKRRAEALGGLELPAKKPDIDNQIKLILDGINAIVFQDDAQICRIMATKVYGESPLTKVRVTPIRLGV